jgi:hypothetical protein
MKWIKRRLREGARFWGDFLMIALLSSVANRLKQDRLRREGAEDDEARLSRR